MAVAVESSTFQSLSNGREHVNGITKDKHDAAAESSYWWNTSGRDLANMLHEAGYSEEAQRQFLSFYRDTICPRLGHRPEKDSVKSGVGRDGNPFEYSFELKESTKKQAVRFVVDVTQLRPTNQIDPLDTTHTQQVVDTLARSTPGFDDTWYRSLLQWFLPPGRTAEEQQAIIGQVGYQTPIILGFDVKASVLSPQHLPVLGKVYFPPCFLAAANGLTRWQAVRSAILQLPDIESYPNISRSVELIESYLTTKPPDWQEGLRYLATDLIAPSKARLKVYMRYAGDSFDDIWDYYTLGGRIPGLDEDKEKFRDLIVMASGGIYGSRQGSRERPDQRSVAPVAKKATAIYFALSSDSPYPVPKICFYPANYAPHDGIIAEGLEAWLQKYHWSDGEKAMGDQIRKVLYDFLSSSTHCL
ncbi:MAG: hypothetical protein Q9219_006845 [cf. Caloplaca sp. 3 TL-2023]